MMEKWQIRSYLSPIAIQHLPMTLSLGIAITVSVSLYLVESSTIKPLKGRPLPPLRQRQNYLRFHSLQSCLYNGFDSLNICNLIFRRNLRFSATISKQFEFSLKNRQSFKLP